MRIQIEFIWIRLILIRRKGFWITFKNIMMANQNI